jgi:WD40 repeat protein
MAAGHWDDSVKLWEVASWREKLVLRPEREVRAERLTPRGMWARLSDASLTPLGTPIRPRDEMVLILWGGDTAAPTIRNRGSITGFDGLVFSSDSRFLAAQHKGSNAQIWDMATCLIVRTIDEQVIGMSYSLERNCFVIAKQPSVRCSEEPPSLIELLPIVP